LGRDAGTLTEMGGSFGGKYDLQVQGISFLQSEDENRKFLRKTSKYLYEYEDDIYFSVTVIKPKISQIQSLALRQLHFLSSCFKVLEATAKESV
jgi:hypothetical protein